MIYAVWNGGNGYGPSDHESDLEGFASMLDVKDALRERRASNGCRRAFFPFVNRGNELDYCPCVELDSSFWVWAAADETDGVTTVPDYPDFVVSFGPRGGVRVDPA